MYQQFFVLFAIIFTGYFFKKIGFINEKMTHGLNKFIVYFAYPCLLVISIGTIEMERALLKEFAIMVLFSCLFFAVYGLFSKGYGKFRHFPPRVSNVAEFSMSTPNDGFMGFPVALLFFGQHGLLLMMAHNVGFNLYAFTYGIHLLRRNKEDKAPLCLKRVVWDGLKLLANPNIIAAAIGFLLYFSGFSLDNVIGVYLEMIGRVATPMAMISIGTMLAGGKFFDMFKNHIVWESAMVKLVILPLLTWFGVMALPLPSIMKVILTLGCAFPTGATVTILTQQEGQNAELASKILFFTTMLSMGTIPLTLVFLQNLPG